MKDQKQFWNEAHKNAALTAHSAQQTGFAENIAKLLDQDSKILELGCGEGNDSIYFAKQGHTVTATDFSDVLINQNQIKYKHPELHFIQQDISQPFMFPDSQFDVVYARLSLHYFTNAVTRHVFTEIARVLKPGGKLCFMCKSTGDRLYGQGTQLESDMFELDGHVRHFFSADYAKELLAHNFIVDSLAVGEEEMYGKISGFVKVVATRVKSVSLASQ